MVRVQSGSTDSPKFTDVRSELPFVGLRRRWEGQVWDWIYRWNAAEFFLVGRGLCEMDLWAYVVRGESAAFFLPFNSRTIARIVFQLRVVAGTPNSLSICPR